MWKEKCVYVLNYVKSFKAIHESNSRTRSQQENKKKTLLKTAAYFKVSTAVRLQGQ